MRRFCTGFIALCLFLLMFLGSCVSHDFPEYVCDQQYSFAEDVRPIIETKCAISGCHNGDLGEDVNWNDFQNFQDRAERGIVRMRVTHRIMPPPNSPAGPLTQEQINAIACWADQGALNN